MKLKILALFIAIILNSCGGYNTGVIQKDHKGFIKFTGNTANVSVEINSESRFELNPEIELYELSPGQYNIKVYRAYKVIVNRIIIVEALSTHSIEVP